MPPERLEALALAYVPGEGPIVIDRLGTGLVNESYRVARGGRVYSLRVPAAHAAELGLDREWECRVLARAAAAGIAPAVERCEPRQGILVARWVDGRPWTHEQVRRQEVIDQVAQLVRRIHSLPVPRGARVMSPAGWIAYYQEALRRDAGEKKNHRSVRRAWLAELESPLEARLASLEEMAPVHPTLCHSDLHPLNVVVGADGPVLLDWEYAHVSDPMWDLAGWISNNDLSADVGESLLSRYVRGPSVPGTSARLPLLVWLYDYVCLLWSMLYLKLRPDGPDALISARAQLLAVRLARDSR